MTWRDVQHLLVWTSEWGPLSHNGGWRTNNKKLRYHARFGFGLINAQSLVEAAKDWENVPPKSTCTITPITKGYANTISFFHIIMN